MVGRLVGGRVGGLENISTVRSRNCGQWRLLLDSAWKVLLILNGGSEKVFQSARTQKYMARLGPTDLCLRSRHYCFPSPSWFKVHCYLSSCRECVARCEQKHRGFHLSQPWAKSWLYPDCMLMAQLLHHLEVQCLPRRSKMKTITVSAGLPRNDRWNKYFTHTSA